MENAFGGLGSLAQSARKKELKSARWILIVIGILTIVVNVGFVASARSIVDKESTPSCKAFGFKAWSSMKPKWKE